MTVNLNEYNWRTTKVNKSTGNGSASAPMPLEKSYSWYKRIIENGGTRRDKLKRYNQMDRESVEISKALDVLAEDVSSANADKEEMFQLNFENIEKVKKSTIKTLNYLKDIWLERTDLELEFFHIVRDVLKNGCKIYKKNPDGSLTELVDERIVGYIKNPDDENQATHYLYDESQSYISSDGDYISGEQNSKNVYPIPTEELVVLKNGKGPFGKSILADAYTIWKKLQLLEDSVVIYRVIRAPETRVFYIDTGTLPEHKREAMVEKYKLKLRQKQVMKNGDIDSDFDPHSALEDYFIPTNSQGRGSKVENLQSGGSGQESLEDTKYFGRKLAAKLRIPYSMMDIHLEGRDQGQFNDARVGQVYANEVRYMGMVYRIQNILIKPLYDHFKWFTEQRDFRVIDNVKLEINTPNSFAEYKNIELSQQKLNVYNSANNVNHLAKKYTLKKFMFMSDEDIIENEIEILHQKGLTDEQIKKLSEVEISNIVYGDSRLGEEYGLSGDSGGGRGW